MLTRTTDQKIPYVYIHVCQIMEDLVCIILYISLMIEDIFWVSLMQDREEAHIFYLQREVGKFVHVFAETKVTLKWIMNSNMVKPEKVDHLHFITLQYL